MVASTIADGFTWFHPLIINCFTYPGTPQLAFDSAIISLNLYTLRKISSTMQRIKLSR